MPLDIDPSLGGDLAASIANAAAALGLVAGGDPPDARDEEPRDDEDAAAAEGCRCRPSIERPTGTGLDDRRVLVVDADDCPGDGVLARSPACRATVIDALADSDADVVRTRTDGIERTYADGAVGLLLAAGRFVERVRFHDAALAARACRDPLDAGRRAAGRAGAVARIAAESGLAEGAARAGDRAARGRERTDGYDDALDAFVGPALSRARVSRRPPPGATSRDAYDLPTGGGVRLYDTAAGRQYHLSPVAHGLDGDALSVLAAAYDVLANGSVDGGPRAAGRAVRRVADEDDPVETLAAVLERHTHGLGVFEHFFADERVSDVVVSAPVTDSPVRVVVDGERVRTNVRLTPEGAASLASRFRRESGRAFSRSTPTLDASVLGEGGRRIRVAGVTAPASDGVGFAFRARDDDAWTLARLVAAGSLSAGAAAFLSVAVERGAAVIVAGTRGAGKTTLLGALLWELPPSTRLVSIEDTPELPVSALRDRGRDVQALRTAAGAAGGSGTGPADGQESGAFTPTDALRSALRLGDGALAVGEVRGEEAGALYEAMRVGAHGHAVLGTIHGDSAAAVRERVVSDLGVPPSSFGATDLVVTCARDGASRHVAAVEEVRSTGDDASFVSLFERADGATVPTGAVARGDSALFDRLRRGEESYADLLSVFDRRRTRIERLAAMGLTAPGDRGYDGAGAGAANEGDVARSDAFGTGREASR
ncbi:MAG: ATPase, T2SS/T4P/T4SS family [Haloquadratum sp.]